MSEPVPPPDASTLMPPDEPRTSAPPPPPSHYYPYGPGYAVPYGLHMGHETPPDYLGIPRVAPVTEAGAASPTEGVREQQLGLYKSANDAERERQAAEAERIEAEVSAHEADQKRYAAAYAQVAAEEKSSQSTITLVLIAAAALFLTRGSR